MKLWKQNQWHLPIESFSVRSNLLSLIIIASHHFLVYMLPTIIFEGIWFLSWFILTTVFASVFTRVIWSTLLLFIFNPEQVQIYLYIVSLGTTMYKFWNDMNEPYAKVKGFIATNRFIKTIQSVEKSNVEMLKLSPTQVQNRRLVQDDMYYWLIMKIEYFHELCSLVNISYFVRATMVRMFFTLFIICTVLESLLSNTQFCSSFWLPTCSAVSEAILKRWHWHYELLQHPCYQWFHNL